MSQSILYILDGKKRVPSPLGLLVLTLGGIMPVLASLLDMFYIQRLPWLNSWVGFGLLGVLFVYIISRFMNIHSLGISCLGGCVIGYFFGLFVFFFIGGFIALLAWLAGAVFIPFGASICMLIRALLTGARRYRKYKDKART